MLYKMQYPLKCRKPEESTETMSPVTVTDLYTALYLSVRHREIARN
jgi:hypothetical protein